MLICDPNFAKGAKFTWLAPVVFAFASKGFRRKNLHVRSVRILG